MLSVEILAKTEEISSLRHLEPAELALAADDLSELWIAAQYLVEAIDNCIDVRADNECLQFLRELHAVWLAEPNHAQPNIDSVGIKTEPLTQKVFHNRRPPQATTK
jgi:hypothetical protein